MDCIINSLWSVLVKTTEDDTRLILTFYATKWARKSSIQLPNWGSRVRVGRRSVVLNSLWLTTWKASRPPTHKALSTLSRPPLSVNSLLSFVSAIILEILQSSLDSFLMADGCSREWDKGGKEEYAEQSNHWLECSQVWSNVGLF